MGIIVRIDKKLYKEIKRIQDEFKARGIVISFPEASRVWRMKVKRVDKRWKFPEFS